MVRLWFLGIVAVMVVCAMNGYAAENIGEVRARAARGLTARVPCGQRKLFLDGPSAYVLWLKDDEMVYRYPEEHDLSRIHREDHLCASTGGVCDVTSLVIPTVGDGDAGTYRCRVHYQASPAVDYVVHLVIVDPPPPVQIKTAKGEDVTNKHVGPLALGSELAMACVVEKAGPDTSLTWNREGVMIAHAGPQKDGNLSSVIHLRNLSREDLNDHYDCIAQTADVTDPISARVIVKMIYPPTSVDILMEHPQVEAGVPLVVDCKVMGSEPPPVVSWTLNKRILNPKWHKETIGDNVVLSSLAVTLTMTDNGQELRCRAHHPQLDEDKEANMILDVGFSAECVKKEPQLFGTVPGEMETATCEVDAYPAPENFQWEMPNKTIIVTTPVKINGHKYRYSSTLRWNGTSENVGVLECSGKNRIGPQRLPCPFRVVKGRAPDPPTCQMPNYETHTMRCTPGWDGGRKQILHLQLIDDDGQVIYEAVDSEGHFDLKITPGESNLTARIYASNSLGHSQRKISTIFRNNGSFTLVDVDADNQYKREYRNSLLGICVTLGLVVFCVNITIMRCISRANDLGTYYREPDIVRVDRPLEIPASSCAHSTACADSSSGFSGRMVNSHQTCECTYYV